jgi:hypothetical protein
MSRPINGLAVDLNNTRISYTAQPLTRRSEAGHDTPGANL